MLMSTEEALALVHGEMTTIRDGDVTHQAVQTNLADVICGGNPNDKIIYPRATRRSSSFPLARLERRHSLRLFGSSKRLANSLSRCGSLRHLPYKLANQSDSSSSTEGPTMLAEPPAKKGSLLSRLFRRSGRKRGASAPPAPLPTFSAQFPPTEWFNPRVVHLHSIGTQTRSASSGSSSTVPNSCRDSLAQSHGTIAPWTDEDTSSRAATLPRRHRRHASGDSAMSLATNPQSQTVMTTSSSTPRSSRRHRSPSQSSTLPRRSSSSNSTSRASVLPNPSPSKTSTLERHNHSPSQSSVVTSNHSTPNKSSLQQNGSLVSFNSSKSISSSPCKSLTSHSNRNSPNHTLLSSNRASPSKIPYNSSASVNKSNSSSRHSSPAKGKSNVVSQQSAQKVDQGSPSSKSSITLQVSATNRSSPPSTSGYSSQYQSSNGRSSVLSTASTLPFQEPPAQRSVTVTSESPSGYGGSASSSTTTTTTVNGSNTKIYVQQQNSPVRSVITFENGVRNNVNGCTIPSKDIIIINGNAPHHEVPAKEAVPLSNGKCNEATSRQSRPRLERPTSLYSPREVLKAGSDAESVIAGKPDASSSVLEKRRFPSVESLNCSEAPTNNNGKLTNNFNYNNKSHQISNELLASPAIAKNKDSGDACNINTASSHPNAQPPSTPTSSDRDPTMNNARVLPTQATSPALPTKNKDGLNYKNVLRNESLSNILASNGDGLKNNCCSNPSSPTKSFDSFGGSYGNLYIEHLDGNDKLLSASMKNLEERSNSDLCPYPSLNDLTVHFKSIAAQKILKGVSINSIDTLVEVNMAAAEKQNNCDVTIHTDFGVV